MSLTVQDHKTIKKIVKDVVKDELVGYADRKELREIVKTELKDYATREEMQEMLKAVDGRFNDVESKIASLEYKIDNNVMNKLDAILFEIQNYRTEQDASSHKLSKHSDDLEEVDQRLSKIEKIPAIKLGLAL